VELHERGSVFAMHRPLRGSLRILSLCVCAAVTLAGCGSGHDAQKSADGLLPDECNEFVASYQRYLAGASAGAGAVARARVEQTRTALLQEALHENLPALKTSCRDSLRTIPANARTRGSTP
jgi:hypothetical protein